MTEMTPARPDERPRAGETADPNRRFAAAEVAAAFEVAIDRVRRAMLGEFGLDERETVDSKQAQHLAEVILGDRPLADRLAALMRLGAYTPRADDAWGLGDTPPGEESDRLAARAGLPDDELASRRSSHDPAYPTE